MYMYNRDFQFAALVRLALVVCSFNLSLFVLPEILYFDRGEVITRMRHKRATKFVTSDEMTLCEFYGAILLFRNVF